MKTKKYKYGTTDNSYIKDYLPNPAEVLQQDNINIAQAKAAGATDPLSIVMKALGGLTMATAPAVGGMIGKGGGDSNFTDVGDPSDIVFALGGISKGENIEVEGDEVIEYPNGTLEETEGASHENGGIDMFLPDGTKVYSDRIKVGGQTMAERKKARETQLSKLEKLMSDNPTDSINKETYDRTKEVFDAEEEQDLNIQSMISTAMQANKNMAAYGLDDNNFIEDDPYAMIEGLELTPEVISSIKDYTPPASDSPSALSSITTDEPKELNFNASPGDVVSLGGDIFSTLAPLINTLKNRASDTPNINAYKDYGIDALDTIDESKQFLQGQEDKALSDIALGTLSARKRARGSARGIQTQRALDLAIEQQANRSKSDVYSTMADKMMQILGQEANLENVQDQAVMAGEAQRDIADRQDKDQYSTNLAANLSGVGQGIQTIGKDLNSIRQREIMKNIMSNLSEFMEFDEDGNLINK